LLMRLLSGAKIQGSIARFYNKGSGERGGWVPLLTQERHYTVKAEGLSTNMVERSVLGV
jgi:hypothetical protein